MDVHHLQAMVDGIGHFVGLVGADGKFQAINDRWREETERLGIGKFGLGCSYPADLAALINDGDTRLEPVLQAYREVSHGIRQQFHCVYHGSGVLSGNDYDIVLSRMAIDGARFVLVSAQDLTELNSLKQEQRRTHGQILRDQEEHRRLIARELHDSTAQSLVALKLSLANLGRHLGGDDTRDAKIVDQCAEAVETILQEVRSFSFLANSHIVASEGLSKALAALGSGFAMRSGVEINLQLADVGKVSGSVSACLFRLAQEALATIHRHPEARQANLRLVGTERFVHLIISGDGHGLAGDDRPQCVALGIGIFGMRERVQELGGRFSVRRTAQGTVLSATMPKRKSDVARTVPTNSSG